MAWARGALRLRLLLEAAALLLLVGTTRAEDPATRDRCRRWFMRHQTPLAYCKEALIKAAAAGARDCPGDCNAFNDLPVECNTAVKMALTDEANARWDALERFDVCDLVCSGGSEGAGGCPPINAGVLVLVNPVFRLPEPRNEIWPKWEGNGTEASSVDIDSGGSSMNDTLLVAVVVGANALLLAAVATFFLVRRHRQRQRLAHLDSSGDSSEAGSDWKPSSGRPPFGIGNLDSAEAGEVQGSPALAVGVRPDSARAQQLAAVWAGAAQAAVDSQPTSQPSTQQHSKESSGPRSLDDPMLAWISSQLTGQQQRHSGGSSSGGMRTPSSGPGPPPLLPAMSSRRSSGPLVDLAPWEVQYSDLKIVRPLGEGSFGRVFLATHHETMVAVKLLLSADEAADVARDGSSILSVSSPIMQALHKECGLMASLRHPNVVLFCGVCYTPPAIVTEFCSRGSLHDVLRGAAQSEQAASVLTWPRRLNIALDAAKGMLCLHTHSPPILHRDLKSPNLLVDAAWRCKVADFNLSRLLEDTGATQSAATTGGGLLNPRWLAPEVLTGGSATAASDVFSFGVVLWELLTWQLPWEGRNAFQLVFSVSKGERLPVPALEQVPGPQPSEQLFDAYVALLQRCWAQLPEERPAFNDVITDLRTLMALATSAPTPAKPANPT